MQILFIVPICIFITSILFFSLISPVSPIVHHTVLSAGDSSLNRYWLDEWYRKGFWLGLRCGVFYRLFLFQFSRFFNSPPHHLFRAVHFGVPFFSATLGCDFAFSDCYCSMRTEKIEYQLKISVFVIFTIDASKKQVFTLKKNISGTYGSKSPIFWYI